MANQKFACPHCQQHIEAEAGYAGMQINCPACGGSLIVPGTPPVPVPTQPVYSIQHTPAPASISQAPASGSCPSCGAALARGAVLCTKCGYNTATGKRMVAGKVVAPGKPAADPWSTPWYKTPYPYVGAVILILGILYFLGRSNPTMKLAFVGFAVLYYVAAHIIVSVGAFRDGIGTGFLALCIGIYTIYWVFKVNENDSLKIIYGVAIALALALRFLDS